MDDSQLWRRLLLNNLLEASARFASFAGLFGGFVRPVFESLAEERAQWAWVILREHPDPELTEALALKDASRPDGIDQQVELAGREGEVYAAEVAIDKELKTLDLVEGMSETELPDPLRLELGASLRDGVERLRRAVHRTRSRGEGIKLSTGRVEKGTRPDEGDRVFDVWFGTNRTPIEKGGVTIGFSGDTSPLLTLGRCGVTIPRSHRIGERTPPLWRRALLGERPLSLETVAVLAEDEFWASVRERAVRDGAGPEDAIVFLHGYNVSFEEAAVCAAQIGADLNLPGAMAFFSWPSQGSIRAYPADEASIEASEAVITEFLEGFSARSGARRVHLIAHSMGNRGLLRAMDRIAARASQAAGKPFGQIILAAPDVDRRTFAMLCEAYPRVGSRTTLYVSSKDVAVRSSRFVHAAARVGYEPPVTIHPKIDTVSVSKVDLSLLGHGYVAACRTVLTDIHQLIVSGLGPNMRAGMKSLESEEGGYWELAE